VRRGFEALAAREDGTPASRATVMAQTAMVKSLLSFGARVRYLPANLGDLFKLKAVPADRARRILSEPDTFVLLRSADGDRDALLLEVGYYGGLRVSELVCLTWSHLLDREDFGVNQQIAPSIVVGLQLEGSVGDISFDGHGSRAYTYFNDAGPTGETATGTFRPHVHSPFMVSALARAGWLADPTTMIYGLAGWTGAQFNYENLTDNPFFEPKDQFWANGLTVGGGLEKKLSPNWSTRFEYRYTHFFASDVNSKFQFSSTFPDTQSETLGARFAEDMQMGRIGISYLVPVSQ
jgi:opacity protein-like surface antigen